MLKKLFLNLTNFLNGEKNKKNSPISMLPSSVIDELVDQAEAAVDVVDQAVVNVTDEVKTAVKAVKKKAVKKPAVKKTTDKKNS